MFTFVTVCFFWSLVIVSDIDICSVLNFPRKTKLIVDCVIAVMGVSVVCSYFSRCSGPTCGLYLWPFLVMLTCFLSQSTRR